MILGPSPGPCTPMAGGYDRPGKKHQDCGHAGGESESEVGFGDLGAIALMVCGEETEPLKSLASEGEALAFLRRRSTCQWLQIETTEQGGVSGPCLRSTVSGIPLMRRDNQMNMKRDQGLFC